MPPHTHTRRTEIYLYFDLEPGAAASTSWARRKPRATSSCANRQAVLSPPWSTHFGAATSPYAFVWSMGGENQEFEDMQAVALERLTIARAARGCSSSSSPPAVAAAAGAGADHRGRSLVARAGDPRAHRPAAIPGAGVPARRPRVPRRRPDRLHAPRSARRSRPVTRAGGGRVVVPAGDVRTGRHPPAQQRQAARLRGLHPPLQHRSRGLPARGLHALGRHRADELLAARLRLRGGERRRHRQGHARRPGGREHWWPWKSGDRRRGAGPEARSRRASSGRRRKACPWSSGSTARATTCGRPSSRPTAAATSSSRTSPCATRPSGASTPCSRPTSPCAA